MATYRRQLQSFLNGTATCVSCGGYTNLLITPCDGGNDISVSYGSFTIGLGSVYQYTLNGSATTYCGTIGAATNTTAAGSITTGTELSGCNDNACTQ